MMLATKLRDKLENTLIAVVVEGGAEAAIIDILLDEDLLFFSRDDIFNREVIQERSGKNRK